MRALIRCPLYVVFSIFANSVAGSLPVGADEKTEKQPSAVEKLLGSAREVVRRQLGKPDRTDKDFDSFYKAGVVVDYDMANRVSRVNATQFVSGDAYRGKVLGIGLGAAKKDCIAVWGDPAKTEEMPFEYAKLTWHHKGYILTLEVWAKDGDGSDKAFGKYKKDTVKDIAITKKSD
jgi:hypothetical protein